MKNRNIVTIIIFTIILVIITISPIIIINSNYVKEVVINLLKSKENAYEYMQFLSGFLGASITVAGTMIAIKYQIFNESKVQKEIGRQIDLREKLSEHIINIKLNLHDIDGEIAGVEYVAEGILNYEKSIFKYNIPDKTREDAKNNYNSIEHNLNREFQIFKVALECYKVEIDEISKNIPLLNKYIEEVEDSIMIVGMKICGFPEYTSEMLESLLKDIERVNGAIIKLQEQLDDFYKAINYYYKKEL